MEAVGGFSIVIAGLDPAFVFVVPAVAGTTPVCYARIASPIHFSNSL
jgi:hypothetical protein